MRAKLKKKTPVINKVVTIIIILLILLAFYLLLAPENSPKPQWYKDWQKTESEKAIAADPFFRLAKMTDSLQKLLNSKTVYVTVTDTALTYAYQKQRCILNIMVGEGFSDTMYCCPAGQKTIGFGHAITSKDTFKKPINFLQAYSLLQSDFDDCVTIAKQMGYHKDNGKQLAIAHALYGLGYGNVAKIKDFKKEILGYCFYSCKGDKKKSKGLLKGREFELELWNQ